MSELARTDRMGLTARYYAVIDGRPVVHDRLAPFLAEPGFSPRVDREAVADLIANGWIGSDRTLLEGVRMVPPASFLLWDEETCRFRVRPWWTWYEVPTDDVTGTDAEIAEECARLFRQAVARCLPNGNRRVGLQLSGGYDSRAILAAIPDDRHPIPCVSYGMHECDDIRIAREAAALRGDPHHVFEVNADNWLDGKELAVWRADGMLECTQIHFLPYLPFQADLWDHCLSGYLGDSTIRGWYARTWGANRERDVLRMHASRCIGAGQRLLESGGTSVGRPFVEDDFLLFVMQIPAKRRASVSIYLAMLLRHFPEYFPTADRQRDLVVDRSAFLRARRAHEVIGAAILSPMALIREFGGDRARGLWERHQAGEDHAIDIGRWWTFETWLQQAFNGRAPE